MIERNNTQNNNGPWWKPGMQIFSEISTWIAFPAILSVIAGKYLDTRFNTKPWLLIACVALAFGTSAYGIVKSVKNFSSKLPQRQSAEEAE